MSKNEAPDAAGTADESMKSTSLSPMRHLVFSAAYILLAYTIAFSQEPVPRFSDYPAKVIRTTKSVKVRIHSTPDTVCFRSKLRTTARKGEGFAGHYALSYWGCGTECARIGIVDLITGRAYVSPFSVSGVGIKTRIGSRLVLVNDPNVVGKNFGDPTPARYLPVYFVWTGR